MHHFLYFSTAKQEAGASSGRPILSLAMKESHTFSGWKDFFFYFFIIRLFIRNISGSSVFCKSKITVWVAV